jgi:hypothetical protein
MEDIEMQADFVVSTTNWRCVTDSANFTRLKAEKSFWSVIALARVVNAMRFVQMPLLEYEGKDSPSAMRARLNSFFFSSALFYEAALFIQNLPKPYREMPEFKSMAEVVNRKDARALRDTSLDNLRNKLVFHFDLDEVGKHVQKLKHPVFLTGQGTSNGEVYYEIADVCAFEAFMEPHPAGTQDQIAVMNSAADLLLDFVNTAEEFLTAYLNKEGWWIEPVSTSHYPGLLET